jgi:predicted SAM-dependent methyltransferase
VRLNLGAGSALLTGWTNLDRVPLPGIDVVHDLDSGPWPFESSSMDQIMAKDVFEHVADPILFMTECHRILRPRAGLFILCPYYKGRDAYTDPTHKRFPTEHTFDYWIPGTTLYNANNRAYGAVAFATAHKEVHTEYMSLTLLKIV